jgi:hypothetical protein
MTVMGEISRRLHLGMKVGVLSSMPSELIEEGFQTLADDRSFSPKMRDKFRAVLGNRFGYEDEW